VTLAEILKTEQPEPSRIAWDAWDRRMRWRLGWRSAIRWGGIDENGTPFRVGWHWPHRRFANWRVYPVGQDHLSTRLLGATRLHGNWCLAWWFSAAIVVIADQGLRDIPAVHYEMSAPAIHGDTGSYAGGGREGATAREWPDFPPKPYHPMQGFLRNLKSD
jgi:hypothetical protein